jgi:primosomal protein N' (replication factor Y)
MPSTEELFARSDQLPDPAPIPRSGVYVQVAIEQSIDRILDYSVPKKLISRIQVGHRVRVPLGKTNRKTHGYVVAITDTSSYPRIKPIEAIDDDRVLIRPKMMQLARWIAKYYVSPLGMVLENIIPSAVKKRIGLGYTRQVRPTVPRQQLQEMLETTRHVRRRAVLARLLQVEEGQSIEIHQLALEAGSTVQLIRKLASEGLLTIQEQADLGSLDSKTCDKDLVPPAYSPNEQQQKIIDEVRSRLGKGFSTHLLFGVTGSGKTEVYLRCIESVVAMGKQAIVLVPEIALTPQTVRRFVERFPRVAVQHSALTQTERHQSWQQIASGAAQVVVGARSAIFAPTPDPGLIVVDEEHEPSYKQDNIPRYHARDVAIKRAQIEGIPVLLGSATPSLESWLRIGLAGESAESDPTGNRYLLRLDQRVRGLALPKVELVDMKQANRTRKGIHLFSPRLETVLKQTLEAGQQAILMLNRRGYANCIFCNHCNEPVLCKYCDATMTYHRASDLKPVDLTTASGVHVGQMHCHYCLAVQPLPATCPTCGKKLSLFGLGTQRVEEELQRKFPGIRYARADSDTMRRRSDYEALLARFGRGEISVLLGTQMIAKGLDYPNVTLVGVISGDTALALPDFRSAERTFQLITQVAGRAGRGDQPGRVIVQTFLGHDPALSMALKHDFEGFATTELAQRKRAHLPPYVRMVRLILRDTDITALHKRSDDLAQALNQQIHVSQAPVELRGPMPCAIERIANHHRAQIILTSVSASAIQQVLSVLRTDRGLVSNQKLGIDVDPVSML